MTQVAILKLFLPSGEFQIFSTADNYKFDAVHGRVRITRDSDKTELVFSSFPYLTHSYMSPDFIVEVSDDKEVSQLYPIEHISAYKCYWENQPTESIYFVKLEDGSFFIDAFGVMKKMNTQEEMIELCKKIINSEYHS